MIPSVASDWVVWLDWRSGWTTVERIRDLMVPVSSSVLLLPICISLFSLSRSFYLSPLSLSESVRLCWMSALQLLFSWTLPTCQELVPRLTLCAICIESIKSFSQPTFTKKNVLKDKTATVVCVFLLSTNPIKKTETNNNVLVWLSASNDWFQFQTKISKRLADI